MHAKKRANRGRRAGRHTYLKRLLMPLLAIMVFFSQTSAFPIGEAIANDGSTESGQLFDSVTLKNSDGQVIDASKDPDTGLQPGESISLEYDWSQKSDQTVSSGAPVTVKIPAEIAFEKNAAGEVKTAKNERVGSYAVNAEAGTLTVKFSEDSDKLAGANGTITLDAAFSSKIQTDKDSLTLNFDLGGGQTTTVTVPVDPADGAGEATEKSSTSDGDAEAAVSSDGSAAEPGSKTAENADAAQASSASGTDQKTTETEGADSSKSPAETNADVAPQAEITENIITGVTLKDEEGNPYTLDNPAETDAPANIYFTWAIPDALGETINAGDTYEFDLPDQFIMHNPVEGELDEYGTFTVDMNGHVVMTFNDQVKQHSKVSGTLFVETQFDEQKITGSTDQEIEFPFVQGAPKVPVNFKSPAKDAIEKAGSQDKVLNPTKVTWTVDINKPLAKIENAKVTEAFPEGLTFASVKVYRLGVNVDGTVQEPDEDDLLAEGKNYSVDENGNVTFTDPNPIHTAYRLVYETTINDDAKPAAGGKVDFVNKATLSGDGFADSPATASVTADYGKMIEKANTGYNGDDNGDQVFSWEIKYNFGEKHIEQSDATITDTFDTDLELIDGLKIQKVDFDAGGHPKLGDELTAGEDYTLSDTGTGFTIQFSSAVDSAYVITYQTKVKDGVIIDGNTPFTNTATTGTGETGEAGKPAQQQNIVKGYSNVNYTNKTVDWNITINKNNYEMHDWKLSDQFMSGGQQLVDGSLKIQDVTKNKTLEAGTDYTLTPKTDGAGFDIAFIGDYAVTSSRFLITYSTNFNTDFSNNKTVKNTATATWTDKYDTDHTNDSSAGFDVNNETQFNGFKNGSYNAESKEITWRVGVNYNGEQATNPSIIDPITGNQQFIPGSVVVKSYTIDKNGEIKEGGELDRANYEVVEPSESNDNTLTVNFKTNDSNQYMVIFKTSLEGQVIHKQETYENTATYHNEGYPDRELKASVSIANGDEHVTKGGTQNGEYIDWAINVNASQSMLNDVTITDTPDTNQILDENSFEVYQAQYDENGAKKDGDGNLIANADKKLEKDQDYTLTVKTDNETGEQRFELTFIGDYAQIDRAYVIKYRALINIEGSNGDVTNDVSISGNNVETVKQDTEKLIKVQISTGGGSGTGERGSLKILKSGSDGKVLPGATFELWNEDQTQLLRTGETDENGSITFGNIRYGNYILKEVEAPAGYTISDELANGKTVTIDAASSAEGASLPIENEQNKVTLIKQNVAGQLLPGAVFKLEQKDPISGNYTRILDEETISSNERGKVEIPGLIPGNYRITEISAPAGYLVNTEPIDFTVEKNGKNQVLNVDLGTFVNYQGRVELTKTDKNGGGLEGAVFKIVDSDGTTVRENLISGTDGKVGADGLAPGAYDFVETKAPEGYLLNKEKVHFTIGSESSGEPAVVTKEAVNYQGSVKLTKVNENGDGLEGAIFNIVDENNKTVREGLTSGADGKVSADDLAPGAYDFVETKAPEGYLLNKEKVHFTIDSESSGKPAVVTKEAVNYQGSVELTKVDKKGNGLSGATFKIVDTEGTTVQEGLTSNATGTVRAEGLTPGSYSFVETKAPEGYVLNTDPIEFIIADQAVGKPVTVTTQVATNYQGSATLVKKDSADNPLRGAVFSIVDENGETVQSGLASNENGIVSAFALAPGSYRFVETQAPEGYILNTAEVPFTIKDQASGEPVNVNAGEAINYKGSAELVKTDQKGKTIEGAVFDLQKADGSVIKSGLTTNSNGKISVSELAPGDYQFVETQAANGYLLDAAPKKFTISDKNDGAPEKKIVSKVNSENSVVLTKVDKNDLDAVLVGAEFKLTDKSGKVVTKDANGNDLPSIWTTDENGQFTVKGLPEGEYQFIETKAPEGYELDPTPIPFKVTKTEADAIPITAENALNETVLTKVDKNDPDAVLVGAEFKLTDKSGKVVTKDANGNELPPIWTTNDKGMFTVNGLAEGEYQFIETKAPEGYELDPTPIPFKVTRTGTKAAEITAKDEINETVLTKVDKNDPDAVLVGAEFKLTDKSGKMVTKDANGSDLSPIWTTDENGQFTVNGLAEGEYQFIETKAPEGYKLDPTPIPFTVTKTVQKAIEITAKDEENEVVLTKVDKNDPDAVLVGAEFKLVDKAGNEVIKDAAGNELPAIWTTNDKGQFTVNGLAEGEYQFIEVKAPNGYELDPTPIPFTVTKTDQKAIEITAKDEENETVLTKVDKNDPDAVLVGGEFKLTDKSGKAVTKDAQGNDLPAIWTTDENGQFTVKGLAEGEYQFIEVKAPNGYEVDPTPIPFTVSKTGTNAVEVTSADELTEVVLTKVDKNDPDAVLVGAEFKLTDKSGKIVTKDANGTDLSPIWTTDKNGQFTVKGLPEGEYQFIETKAPEGYKLDPTPIPFTVTKTGTKAVEITAYDEINETVLTKVDKNDPDAVLVGAEFKLTDKSGKTVTKDANGNDLPSIWTTDKNGQFTVKGLPEGDYQFIETKAPAGYELDPTPIPFKVTRTGGEAIEITATDKLTPGDVRLTKVDKNDPDAVLAGAEFRLTDSNGKTLKTGLTTDGSGQFVVTDLAPGKYFFIETKAPEGYKLDDTPIPFIIEKGQAKAVEITATNEAIRTDPDLGRGSGAVVNKNTGNGANETKPLPKTGDTNDIASMVAGAALLLTGGIIIVLARRRRSH